MKHGPQALIEEGGLPVIVIAPKDKYFEKLYQICKSEVNSKWWKKFYLLQIIQKRVN